MFKAIILGLLITMALLASPKDLMAVNIDEKTGILHVNKFNLDNTMDYVEERNGTIFMHLYSNTAADSVTLDREMVAAAR